MKHALRLFHTVRHLKIRQLVYRLYYRWRRLSVPLEQCRAQARAWGQHWNSPQWQISAMPSDGQFRFLNELGSVNSASDWNNPGKSKLWLYNLHYLDELNSKGADKRVEVLNGLIDQWIDDNPAPHGDGWEPYPLSLRLVNLVKWHMRHHYKGEKLLGSIQQQAAALSKQVEYHIMANHLFANGKALVFAGAALDGGDAFLQQGLRILDAEISEQFLEDGGHFEFSPMYHAILLWDLCDLLNLVKSSLLPDLQPRIQSWSEAIQRGLSWLAHMCHPDGDIAFFNDSTLGIAPRYADICQYALTLGVVTPTTSGNACLSLKHLKNSGYAIASGPVAKLILDVGHVGPAYQPGHAHADTLSFELSIFGQRVFVNSGISQYGINRERSYQRSTQAHNTVSVNNKNSSDVWGGFRVGRRARPQNFQLTQTPEQVIVDCSHDGYHSVFNPLTHSRQWQITQQYCRVIDNLTGSYQHAEARYHLHPDITIKQLDSDRFVCVPPLGKSILIKFTGHVDLRIENTRWFPGFGIHLENHCLIAVLTKKPLRTDIIWWV